MFYLYFALILCAVLIAIYFIARHECGETDGAGVTLFFAIVLFAVYAFGSMIKLITTPAVM